MRGTQMSLSWYWVWSGMGACFCLLQVAVCHGGSSCPLEQRPTVFLIPQRNAERPRSADQITVSPYSFDFSDRVPDFDRADLRAGESDHLSEIIGGDKFHRLGGRGLGRSSS